MQERARDDDEGRAQHVAPEGEEQGRREPPPDPDRPSDEVREGNILVEPAPGD